MYGIDFGTSNTVVTVRDASGAAASRVLDELEAWAAEQGVSDINELIGAFEC